MKTQIYPQELILRCYGHQIQGGRFYGVCVDLDIAAEADSAESLKRKLNEMISSYIHTALDTDDKDSIPELLARKAPLFDWVKYYVIGLAISVKKSFRHRFTFKASVPFHLGNDCYGREVSTA